MHKTLPLAAVTAFSLSSSPVPAQTLTQATSIPAIGRIENHNHYYDAAPAPVATTGTGVVWDATGVSATGTYVFSTYQTPSASPYASSYPTGTICALVESNGSPNAWYHWNASSTVGEFLGRDDELYIGGRTMVEFPFDIGDSFYDSYTIFSITSTDTVEYVASGSITAPWGTMNNVVMFEINGGVAYLFYHADNLLNSIGSYVPGFGLEVHEVTLYDGIQETTPGLLGITPTVTDEQVTVALPADASSKVTIVDATGRVVLERSNALGLTRLDVAALVPGGYRVIATAGNGVRRTGTFMIQR